MHGLILIKDVRDRSSIIKLITDSMSALFWGEGVCQMLTFDDMRGEGVESRMMTSAMLSLKMQHFRILETFLISEFFQNFMLSRNVLMV